MVAQENLQNLQDDEVRWVNLWHPRSLCCCRFLCPLSSKCRETTDDDFSHFRLISKKKSNKLTLFVCIDSFNLLVLRVVQNCNMIHRAKRMTDLSYLHRLLTGWNWLNPLQCMHDRAVGSLLRLLKGISNGVFI